MALGSAALSVTELLTLLWGSGSTDAAGTALANHGNLTELGRADVLELTKVPGIGVSRAAQLAAAFEIGRRSIVIEAERGRWSVRAPRDVADRLSAQMSQLEHEELRV